MTQHDLSQYTQSLLVILALSIVKHSSEKAIIRLFDTSVFITRDKLIAQKQITAVN